MSVNVTRVTTGKSLRKNKPLLCFRCGSGNTILTRDPNGTQVCVDCIGAKGDPIRQSDSIDQFEEETVREYVD